MSVWSLIPNPLFPVTLQCTKDAQFIIVVSRDATQPAIDLESIALLGDGESCKPVGITSAFAIYQFNIQQCGTVVMVRAATDTTAPFALFSILVRL